MKAHAIDKTRTTRSIRIEAAIETLSQILGSRNEVIMAMAEMLVADSDLTEKQRHQVFEEIQKMYGDQEEKMTRHFTKLDSKKKCSGQCVYLDSMISHERPQHSPYISSIYCSICKVYFKNNLNELWCPCCSTKLRSHPR